MKQASQTRAERKQQQEDTRILAARAAQQAALVSFQSRVQRSELSTYIARYSPEQRTRAQRRDAGSSFQVVKQSSTRGGLWMRTRAGQQPVK